MQSHIKTATINLYKSNLALKGLMNVAKIDESKNTKCQFYKANFNATFRTAGLLLSTK